MFDLFSDYFASRASFASSLDCRVKIILTVLAIVTILFSKSFLYPLGIFVFCVIAMFLLKLPSFIVFVRMLPALGMAAIVFLLKMFLSGGIPVFDLSLGGFELSATAEGIEAGTLIASRVVGSVAVALLLGFVTPLHQLFRGLAWFGVSKTWVEIAMFTYRYTFHIMDTAMQVMSAQKVRLGYVGAMNSFSSAGTLSGSLIINSFKQTEKIAEAMIARGYTGEFPDSPMPRAGFSDILFFIFAVAVMAVFFFAGGLP